MMQWKNLTGKQDYIDNNDIGATSETEIEAKKRNKINILWFIIPVVLVLSVLGIAFIVTLITINVRKTGSVTTQEEVVVDTPVSIIKESYPTCIENPDDISDYIGRDYILLNKGKPNFTQWDIDNIKGQNYSDLDYLGRCGTAVAMLERSMMPTEERSGIGQIKPTGWIQNKYEGIVKSNPPYLYNRCHLIAYALTGENVNEKNLITGTRYMNVTAMLPWEEKVMKYLDKSSNHVLYRVTPYFEDNNLLATGVEMEAYSVEDNGEGVCFHVFIYNVQPGVVIDYATGENWEANEVKVQIQIGNKKMTATLENNAATADLIEILSDGELVMSASNYGGFEKVCSIGQSISSNDEQITTVAGDIMLYNGNQLVIFYDSNSWAYTPIGHIEASAEELKSFLSGDESEVKIRLSE